MHRLGIKVNVRLVDSAQYENRLRQRDYDIVTANWGESLSPGNEQRGYWGSAAADQPGSRNLVGIKNPAVDKLIDRIVYAQDREESGGGHPRARSRVAVEFLRGAAMDLRQAAHRALGPLLPSADHAEIRGGRLPGHLVVGQGKGGQGAGTVSGLSTVMAVTSRSPTQKSERSRRALAAARLKGRVAQPLRLCRPYSRSRPGGGTARHGMSAFGDLKLPPDFKHFPYVNPEAPKGGRYSEMVSSRGYNGSFLTFDSLNGYILKGDGAYGMDLTFATLMVASGDEPDAMYGLAAQGVRISDFGLTIRSRCGPRPSSTTAARSPPRSRLVADHAESPGTSAHHQRCAT